MDARCGSCVWSLDGGTVDAGKQFAPTGATAPRGTNRTCRVTPTLPATPTRPTATPPARACTRVPTGSSCTGRRTRAAYEQYGYGQAAALPGGPGAGATATAMRRAPPTRRAPATRRTRSTATPSRPGTPPSTRTSTPSPSTPDYAEPAPAPAPRAPDRPRGLPPRVPYRGRGTQVRAAAKARGAAEAPGAQRLSSGWDRSPPWRSSPWPASCTRRRPRTGTLALAAPDCRQRTRHQLPRGTPHAPSPGPTPTTALKAAARPRREASWPRCRPNAQQVLLVTGTAKNASSSKAVLYTRDRRRQLGCRARPGPAHNAKGRLEQPPHGRRPAQPDRRLQPHRRGAALDANPGTKLPYLHSSAFKGAGDGLSRASPLGRRLRLRGRDQLQPRGRHQARSPRPAPLGASRGGGIWIHVGPRTVPTHGCISLSKAKHGHTAQGTWTRPSTR